MTFEGRFSTVILCDPLTRYPLAIAKYVFSLCVIGSHCLLVFKADVTPPDKTGRSPPRCTKCNSPPINGQCTNFVLFDVTLKLRWQYSKGLTWVYFMLITDQGHTGSPISTSRLVERLPRNCLEMQTPSHRRKTLLRRSDEPGLAGVK